MEQNIIYSILLIIIGIINLVLSIKFIKDLQFSRQYIETNPKAWILRKVFGIEKAFKITRYYFAPFGIILGVLFILLGIVFLFI